MNDRDDLAHLRYLARIQRDTAVEQRVRNGEDPATVTTEEPEVDEIVIAMMRDELLDARGLAAEYSLARLAASGTGPDAEHLAAAADDIDTRLYREIALKHPELTRTAWRLMRVRAN